MGHNPGQVEAHDYWGEGERGRAQKCLASAEGASPQGGPGGMLVRKNLENYTLSNVNSA